MIQRLWANRATVISFFVSFYAKGLLTLAVVASLISFGALIMYLAIKAVLHAQGIL